MIDWTAAAARLITGRRCLAPEPQDGHCPACHRPALLDLFCCEGGAGVGYALAGFCVRGVDLAEQPRYPFRFRQGDALAYAEQFAARYALVHGSPPCQRFSDLAVRNGNADAWPDLVTPLRPILVAAGVPYVIENVESCPILVDPTVLCGTQFPGLRVLRHRKFETSFAVPEPDVAHPARHPLVFTHDKRKAHYGRLDQATSYVQVTGGGNATLANKRAAMGMPWASGKGVNEAIPPAYAHHIGRAFLATVAA